MFLQVLEGYIIGGLATEKKFGQKIVLSQRCSMQLFKHRPIITRKGTGRHTFLTLVQFARI